MSTKKLGERVLIPLKGIFLNANGAKMSGFKNAIVTGILMAIEKNGDLILGTEAGEVITIVPADSVGAVLSEGSSFYQGAEDEIDFDFETEGGVN